MLIISPQSLYVYIQQCHCQMSTHMLELSVTTRLMESEIIDIQ